jgi:hypothetical protein
MLNLCKKFLECLASPFFPAQNLNLFSSRESNRGRSGGLTYNRTKLLIYGKYLLALTSTVKPGTGEAGDVLDYVDSPKGS